MFERPQRNSGKNVRTMAAPELFPGLELQICDSHGGFVRLTFHFDSLLKTDETDDVSCIDPLLQGWSYSHQ